jgi:hypothetical protein
MSGCGKGSRKSSANCRRTGGGEAGRRSSDRRQRQRNAQADADAHGRQRALGLGELKLQRRRAGEPRPGGAERMAERARAKARPLLERRKARLTVSEEWRRQAAAYHLVAHVIAFDGVF